MKKRIPVGLVGATGYTGMELARLLWSHPNFELVAATSRAEAGKTIGGLYPFLLGTPLADVVLSEPDPIELARRCELVFLAVPHGAAQPTAAACLKAGLTVVDLSADFRLRDPEVYEHWYKTPHTERERLTEAVYGLIELYADKIKKARLVANPGCYPTAAILALNPALRAGLVKTSGIVVDAKSGTSGAGRKASVGTLFCEVADTFRAYNLGKHRHTPEIEQELSLIAGAELFVSFNTHLLPINRGILSTAYAELTDPTTTLDDVRAVYQAAYADARFVRILPKGGLPETRHVRGTMFCDIGLVIDPRTNRLIVVSTIDNLCRGASGQAIACANLTQGLDVATGLDLAPLMP